MSTAPPDIPFGDPAANQQRNRSAVGKGVGIACGGCAVLLLLALLAGAGITFFVFKTLSNSPVVMQAEMRAITDDRVLDRLGMPVEKSWLIMGSININNGHGSADVRIPLTGPKGKAELHAIASKDPSAADWQFTTLTLTVSGSGEVLDLLTPPPSG